MNSNKFYTWIDVQDTLDSYFNVENNSKWLKNISFRVYWDGLTIHYSAPAKVKDIETKLIEIFLARFEKSNTEKYLILEGNKHFPISFEKVEIDEIGESNIKPTLSRKSSIAPKKESIIERDSLKKPLFFAFHSFKGGVGRTLHSIAFALQLAEKGKVLLIDADFEAPGITWLVENREIALADFLAMIHGASNHQEVIDFTAQIIKNNTPEEEDIFILPAFRILNETASSILEIKPEHIFKFSKEPFILSDIIEQLGNALGVDYIVMDLRAGLSELSTGWLLDPRITKIFVTTLSSQSLLGTSMLFKILAKFDNKNQIKSQNSPFIIVSQIPKTSIKEISLGWTSDTFDESTLKPLRDAYTDSFIDIEDYKQKDAFKDLTDEQILAQVIAPNAIFSEEYDTLKLLPDSWEAVCKNIRSVNLHKHTSPLVDFLPQNIEEEDFAVSRQHLKEFAEKMIFAERLEIDDLLITESIRKLANRYRTQVPISVIVGAKGAGKTFLYRQIRRLENWKNFIEKVVGQVPNNNALIFPVTIPLHLQQSEITNTNQNENIWLDYIKPNIESSLQDNLTISQWRDKWLDYMAWSADFKVGIGSVGKDFIKFLESQKVKKVGIFDGLEDLFKEFNSNVHQQKALEALLQDVPNWLESQPGKNLGIIVFARKDIVSAAITQNVGQFLDKYSDFELKWNIEEVLRLVNWILIKSNTFKNYPIDLKELNQKNESELIVPLYKLWGMKMAKETSKEALSHNWVLGSLANLKKEVQSRDIVRLLAMAAEKPLSESNVSYDDRILFPANIRQAIEKVGIEKISEVKTENEPLKKVLEILETKTSDIEFPCKVDKIKNVIDDAKIKILEDNGVMTLYNGEYYMAEIYRKGMGFKYSRKGKPKVLYL